ncbi:hypothetical protein IFM89_019699 [Coptis chinensis]|uniref:Thioredoxin domain-containing protein n=1 Tax=Coptis chinensis TaxID=261450 RepID=A0A835GX87_9MAGN|nr:hypothetical protein IFM89_019699 [Coptis chinensis]
MSNSRNPVSDIGFDSLTDRFKAATLLKGKPDFKELDLGSPVSPLRTNGGRPVPTPTSSSSTSSSSGNTPCRKRSDRGGSNGGNNHSGELSGSCESSPTAVDSIRSAVTRGSNKLGGGHKRSVSTASGNTIPPLIYSGGGGGSGSVSSSGSGCGNVGVGGMVNSPIVNALPAGNICPSGKILKTGMATRSSSRKDVLGSGTGNYGHGSIVRGPVCVKSSVSSGGSSSEVSESVMVKRALVSFDIEVVTRVGNEQYKKGHFSEALCLYDRAIAISPDNAACRSNRAAALTGLGRLAEAVRECEEAVRLDPGYSRAHQRLASLHLRLGQIENARQHLCFCGLQPDKVELQNLQLVERHLNRCFDARRIGDWKSAMREGDAAIAAGADSSPQLFACRAEALLKLHQLVDADAGLSNIPKFEPYPPSCSQIKFFGMLSEAYVFYARAQVDVALGRFEDAVSAAEKAGRIDPLNIEVAMLLNNVRLVARARARGNDLFKTGNFIEAASAYGEGLKLDPSNSVLYCNRAACWSKLGQWEKSVEDCNKALRIQPSYTKALLRRAASYGKLEKWAESVRDYEILRKELPADNEVAESLFHAQVALKKLRGEEIHNLKFGGEVEEVSDADQFRAVISLPGTSVVHFKAAANQQCEQISPFMDMLCIRYPSVNFLKVDVQESLGIAHVENVRIVPTIKIYKNGIRVKEMICPSRQVLENSVRHYSL